MLFVLILIVIIVPIVIIVLILILVFILLPMSFASLLPLLFFEQDPSGLVAARVTTHLSSG